MKNILHLYNFLVYFSYLVVLVALKEIKTEKKGSEGKKRGNRLVERKTNTNIVLVDCI